MFTFLLKLKRTIKRLLKVESESRQRPVNTTRARTTKIILLITASVVIAILYPGEYLFDPFDAPRRGEIAVEDIIAPFQITVFKTDRELEEERDIIRLSVPYIVDYDSLAEAAVYNNLWRFLTLVDSLSADSNWRAHENEYVDIVSKQFPLLSKTAIVKSLERNDLFKVGKILERIYKQDIYKIGVVPKKNSIPQSRNKNVLIRRGERENIYYRDKILYMELANAHLLTALNNLYMTDSIDVEYYYLIGRSFIQPDLYVNMQEYNKRLQTELNQISRIKEVVKEGDIIVRAGTKVNERQERIIEEMINLQRSQAAQQGWLMDLLPALARILLTLLSFIALFLFLYYYRKEIYFSNPRLLAMFLVFILQLFFIHILDRWDLSIYAYPIAFLPMMLTILYDSETGILATIVLAILLGIMHRFNFTLSFITIVVGVVTCFSSREVRRRAHFIRIMLLTGLTSAIFILVVENFKLTPQEELLSMVGFGLTSGFVSVLLTLGLLPFFESLFGITTDITLLELSDLNHPLLKRLAVEAPGTYQHSLIVGNLSEAAAKAIGANSLLARVGAYYHDIGKMEIPEYFVENQLSVKSKHESLTPSMSALILSSHVKKGRIIGEAAGLPNDVLNFIEEHHGTMVQSFFYDKALKQGADPSTIEKFRYPGPRPLTRETGIAMLADAVEAASRTLDQPTAARLDHLIQRIINDRFQSGELDDCPLTLRDLARIKKAFAQVLIATFHHRVEYPTKEPAGEVE